MEKGKDILTKLFTCIAIILFGWVFLLTFFDFVFGKYDPTGINIRTALQGSLISIAFFKVFPDKAMQLTLILLIPWLFYHICLAFLGAVFGHGSITFFVLTSLGVPVLTYLLLSTKIIRV